MNEDGAEEQGTAPGEQGGEADPAALFIQGVRSWSRAQGCCCCTGGTGTGRIRTASASGDNGFAGRTGPPRRPYGPAGTTLPWTGGSAKQQMA